MSSRDALRKYAFLMGPNGETLPLSQLFDSIVHPSISKHFAKEKKGSVLPVLQLGKQTEVQVTQQRRGRAGGKHRWNASREIQHTVLRTGRRGRYWRACLTHSLSPRSYTGMKLLDSSALLEIVLPVSIGMITMNVGLFSEMTS
ncbi:unnamed protein product [Lepidochelys kempii]